MDGWNTIGNPMGLENAVAFSQIDGPEITEAKLESAMNKYRDGEHSREIDDVVAEYAPEIKSDRDRAK